MTPQITNAERVAWTKCARYAYLAVILPICVVLASCGQSTSGDTDTFEEASSLLEGGNLQAAHEALVQLGSKGDVRAQSRLGEMYEWGKGVSPNITEAIRWYKLAASQGNVSAQRSLGTIYLEGRKVPQDGPEGLRWLLMAADQGDDRSRSRVARAYATGEGGIPRNPAAALNWHILAAASGNPSNQVDVGLLYDGSAGDDDSHSRYVDRSPYTQAKSDLIAPLDYVEAAKWYQRAANQDETTDDPFARGGVAEARFLLGKIYEHGKGVPVDTSQALNWYEAAARVDTIDDYKVNIARIYDQDLRSWGRRVFLDSRLGRTINNTDEAIAWYRRAAEGGNIPSQLRLGELYSQGTAVIQDYRESLRWYRKAANSGSFTAQILLGEWYSTGRAIPKDNIEAYKWLALAASLGSDEIAALRDQLGTNMSSDEIEAAQKQAMDLRSQPGFVPRLLQ